MTTSPTIPPAATMDLVTPADYRETRAQLFPSKGSMQWYLRQHQSRLIESGALLLIAGRWLCQKDKFDAYVLEAGAAAAQKRMKCL